MPAQSLFRLIAGLDEIVQRAPAQIAAHSVNLAIAAHRHLARRLEAESCHSRPANRQSAFTLLALSPDLTFSLSSTFCRQWPLELKVVTPYQQQVPCDFLIEA